MIAIAHAYVDNETDDHVLLGESFVPVTVAPSTKRTFEAHQRRRCASWRRGRRESILGWNPAGTRDETQKDSAGRPLGSERGLVSSPSNLIRAGNSGQGATASTQLSASQCSAILPSWMRNMSKPSA